MTVHTSESFSLPNYFKSVVLTYNIDL